MIFSDFQQGFLSLFKSETETDREFLVSVVDFPQNTPDFENLKGIKHEHAITVLSVFWNG